MVFGYKIKRFTILTSNIQKWCYTKFLVPLEPTLWERQDALFLKLYITLAFDFDNGSYL